MAAVPAPWDPRVDFVVGGVQKGGTTSLSLLFRSHPAIGVPASKEPHWFDDDERFADGPPDPGPYHALWGPALVSRLCVDVSPAYCWWPGAAERIRAYHPAMKWILLLRDPAERAYSHWNMQRTRGREPLSFEDAIAAEAERLRTGSPAERRRYSYVDRGFYARQLARLWSIFPREQMLVLRSDALRRTPADTAEAIAAFLGVASFDSLPDLDAHAGDYEEPMAPHLRARLDATYADDVAELERMLGWDLADWRR